MHLGGHFLAAYRKIGLRAGLLVAGKIGLNEPMRGAHRRVVLDKCANRGSGDGHHVLSGGIAGVKIETQIDMVAFHRDLHIDQSPVCRGARRRVAESLQLGHHPGHEGARLA